jgi:hypothetical protein
VNRDDVYALVNAERQRQSEKWNREHDWGYGDCSSVNLPNITKAAVLTEECGEVARAVLDRRNPNLRDELVQVAAVAVAWLESFPADTQDPIPGMSGTTTGSSAPTGNPARPLMPGRGM